jgi:ABC-type nickel/cobalt efflux system permease component RcnA
MSVTSCTHSSVTHFIHPFCPYQTSLEKVSKVFLLVLGAAVLWRSYRQILRRAEYENAYRKYCEANKRALHEKTITILERQGTCLDSPSLFCCIEFLQNLFPHKLSYEKAPTLLIDVRLKECPIFEKFLAIPCLIQGWFKDHIVLLLLEKQSDGSYHLEFFDSKGYSVQKNPHAKLIRDDLNSFFTITTFVYNTTRLQHDWNNCGVYITWYLEHRLEGKTAQEIYRLPQPDIESYRRELAGRMRNKPSIP